MSQHSSRSPSIYNEFAPKTCIIINNLQKNDFIIDSSKPQLLSKKLPLVDQIKLSVLNISNEEFDFIDHISYWSSLPFLNRIIIIFKDEPSANIAYTHLNETSKLRTLYPYIKITLQENLLSRSKSSENLINDNLVVSKSLEKFKNFHNDPNNIYNDYSEPEPKQFNLLLDLPKLGIDLSDYNSEEQIEELKQEDKQPEDIISRSLSPDRPPALRRSSTKTLYKPMLHLNTDTIANTNTNTNASPHKATGFPASPTITLDETF
ncbi:hypothetical protein JA1_004044 [Spathaspora sp. JA1]|nr:hypothetical protein JA1_004044 [Spathaspora sp. JA1]